MRRETLSPVLRGPLLTLALLTLTSCLTPESVDCPSGLVCPAGQKCAANQDVCIKTNCGDGIPQDGEACDDGNILDGDGCSRTCASTEACGNGLLDIIPTGNGARREACDDGNTVDGDGCSADCLSSELCGNGVVDKAAHEACDDGNRVDDDGCSADCLSDETCGNNIVDKAVGEVCDDGNTVSGDRCTQDCTSGDKCGNGIREPDEECDDGNASNEDNCLSSCKIATCGDGFVDKETPRIEQCDTTGESKTCNLNCTERQCGDGIVNARAGEECDDGNKDSEDDCLITCKVNTCGDGFVDKMSPRIEACDTGGESRFCNANCTVTDCGDGIVNNSAEACDDGNEDSCGTCNSTCTQKQDASPATGRIIAVPPANLEDKETFIFNAGRGDQRVFEFNTGEHVADGHVRVDIKNIDQSDQVAIAIEQAISDQYSKNGFEWRVATRFWNVVMLEHKSGGRISSGKSITDTVEVPGFLTGITFFGSGYDCPVAMGCMRDEDCQSKKCTIPPGQVIGTCQP